MPLFETCYTYPQFKATAACVQAAAAAAEQAEAAAQASAVQAGQAEQAAQAVARALLVSKRAEIEAADMLEKPKNPKEADPVAAELLKVCSCSTNPNSALDDASVCHAVLPC